MIRPAPRPKHLGSGATVAQLTLDQKVEGSNPSSPASSTSRHAAGLPSRRLLRLSHTDLMASYAVNKRAIAHARRLIDGHQYVLDSDWGDVQPRADDENAFLKGHSWDEYAEWHLGLAEDATDETKSRYAFVYGDFRRVHRTALIALPVPGGRMASQGHRARRP